MSDKRKVSCEYCGHTFIFDVEFVRGIQSLPCTQCDAPIKLGDVTFIIDPPAIKEEIIIESVTRLYHNFDHRSVEYIIYWRQQGALYYQKIEIPMRLSSNYGHEDSAAIYIASALESDVYDIARQLDKFVIMKDVDVGLYDTWASPQYKSDWIRKNHYKKIGEAL